MLGVCMPVRNAHPQHLHGLPVIKLANPIGRKARQPGGIPDRGSECGSATRILHLAELDSNNLYMEFYIFLHRIRNSVFLIQDTQQQFLQMNDTRSQPTSAAPAGIPPSYESFPAGG